MNNTGTVTIKTERLKLRKIRLTDYLAFRKWYKTPEVSYFSQGPCPKAERDCVYFILKNVYNYYFKRRKKYYFWAIALKGKMIGFCGLNDTRKDIYSIYYMLSPDYWNRGYTEEAVKAMMSYMKTQDWRVLFGACDSENLASYRILQHCGFEQIGFDNHHYHYPDGRHGDRILFRFFK